jgi:multiple antibiotic resistance protein
MIGPGAITAAVVLAAIHGVLMTTIAAIVAMLISLLLLLLTGPIYRVLGKIGSDLISRVMGVLIAAIAVGYIRTGVVDLIRKY